MEYARVVKSTGFPTPNTYYNPDSIEYDVSNDISQNNDDRVIYNYPLYFDSMYHGNLFDKHDPVDNPLKSMRKFLN